MSTKSCYKWSILIVVLQRTPSCSCLLLSLSWLSMFLLKSLVYFNVPRTSSCGQVSWLSLGATTRASHTSQPANQLWTLVEFAHIFASPGQFCDLASFCCPGDVGASTYIHPQHRDPCFSYLAWGLGGGAGGWGRGCNAQTGIKPTTSQSPVQCLSH